MGKATLTIMIPSIESRRSMLSELVTGLIQQCGVIKSVTSFVEQGCTILILGFEGVEIIVGIDDCAITTGTKRQMLLNLANNDYVSSIDEDDTVCETYVTDLKEAIQSDADCIEFDGIITTDNTNQIFWQLRMGVQNETIHEAGVPVYLRHINHLSAVKREHALKAGYNDVSNGEDKFYSEGLRPYLKTAHRINKSMYHYRFSRYNKTYK